MKVAYCPTDTCWQICSWNCWKVQCYRRCKRK